MCVLYLVPGFLTECGFHSVHVGTSEENFPLDCWHTQAENVNGMNNIKV